MPKLLPLFIVLVSLFLGYTIGILSGFQIVRIHNEKIIEGYREGCTQWEICPKDDEGRGVMYRVMYLRIYTLAPIL